MEFLRCCGRVRGPDGPVGRSGHSDVPLLGGREEGDQGLRGHNRTHDTAAQAHDVGVVVPSGQAGGRHVVHDGRPDAGDLVGGHGDPVSRAADADTQVHVAPGHGTTHRGAEERVVDGDLGARRPDVDDVVAQSDELGLEDLLEGEPGMVRAEGDAHGGRVYRAGRGSPGRQPGTIPGAWPSIPTHRWSSGSVRSPIRPDPRTDPAERPEPLELMVRALRAAAEDTTGAAPGGAGRGRACPARAGRQHPGRGTAGLADGQPGPPGGRRARLRRRHHAARADADRRRRQCAGGLAARRVPCHLPRRPRRCPGDGGRGDVHPHGRPARPVETGRELVQPADGGDTAAHLVRDGAARGDRPRDRSRGITLPIQAYPLFENRCAPRTDGHWPSTGPASARCGPVSARWPHPTLTPGSAAAFAPRRSPNPRRRTG